MKILDENNVELPSPDLSKGRLVEERLFISHHPAVEAAAEQWHYETTAVYPNGGKDVAKVVDVPGVEAKDAWTSMRQFSGISRTRTKNWKR